MTCPEYELQKYKIVKFLKATAGRMKIHWMLSGNFVFFFFLSLNWK